MARHEQREVYTVTAGTSAPVPLDAAIVFSSDGTGVGQALAQLAFGGCVVCAGPPMRDIASFPFADLSGAAVLVP